MTIDSRPHKTWRVALVVLIGIICSLYFHYRNGYYYNLTYPQNTFLYWPNESANDFYNIIRPVASGKSPYASSLFVYFPFTYLVVWPFTVLGEKTACAVLLFIFSLFITVFVYLSVNFLDRLPRRLVTLILVFLSYPFLFCLDRANFECVVFIFLACFLISFQKNKRWLSVLSLAFATAMKGYPGIFVVLFLSARRVKDVFWTGIATVVLTIVSLLLIPGKVMDNINLLHSNLEAFRHMYVLGDTELGDNGLRFGSSLFSPLKMILKKAALFYPNESFILNSYLFFCVFSLSIIAFFIIFREHTLWKRVALLCFSILLFPHVSFDYKLIHLFLPLTLFLSERVPGRKDSWYATLFGLLLIPKAYAWIGTSDINWGIFLNPLLMILMMGLIFWENFMASRVRTARFSVDAL